MIRMVKERERKIRKWNGKIMNVCTWRRRRWWWCIHVKATQMKKRENTLVVSRIIQDDSKRCNAMQSRLIPQRVLLLLLLPLLLNFIFFQFDFIRYPSHFFHLLYFPSFYFACGLCLYIHIFNQKEWINNISSTWNVDLPFIEIAFYMLITETHARTHARIYASLLTYDIMSQAIGDKTIILRQRKMIWIDEQNWIFSSSIFGGWFTFFIFELRGKYYKKKIV